MAHCHTIRVVTTAPTQAPPSMTQPSTSNRRTTLSADGLSMWISSGRLGSKSTSTSSPIPGVQLPPTSPSAVTRRPSGARNCTTGRRPGHHPGRVGACGRPPRRTFCVPPAAGVRSCGASFARQVQTPHRELGRLRRKRRSLKAGWSTPRPLLAPRWSGDDRYAHRSRCRWCGARAAARPSEDAPRIPCRGRELKPCYRPSAASRGQPRRPAVTVAMTGPLRGVGSRPGRRRLAVEVELATAPMAPA